MTRARGSHYRDWGRTLPVCARWAPGLRTRSECVSHQETYSLEYAEEPFESNPIVKYSGSGWTAHGMHTFDVHRFSDSSGSPVLTVCSTAPENSV